MNVGLIGVRSKPLTESHTMHNAIGKVLKNIVKTEAAEIYHVIKSLPFKNDCYQASIIW
jgi:hypothetical protein